MRIFIFNVGKQAIEWHIWVHIQCRDTVNLVLASDTIQETVRTLLEYLRPRS